MHRLLANKTRHDLSALRQQSQELAARRCAFARPAHDGRLIVAWSRRSLSMALTIDEEFRALIPPLANEEREQLEKNLVSDGCREPLVVWEVSKSKHVLLDGHNRLSICEKHGIAYAINPKRFGSRDEAKVWIINNQFGRRNLPDIDRIALARKREEITRPVAAQKRIETQGRPSKEKLSADLRPVPKIKSSKEAAKVAGVGERTYDAGKMILDAAEKGEVPKEDIEAIRRKEKSIHRVAKDLKEKRQKEKRQSERAEAAAKSEPQFFDNVHVGDFRQHFDKIHDGSLSLIFTDPPYDRKATELFGPLADFASAKLCEGGSLICYVGQTQIPAAMTFLSSSLRYWWTVCCLHSGGANLIHEYGIRCGWKAVLWFVKGTRDNKHDIVSDVMSGGREKSHHDWQQAQSEAEYWIEHLCPKDGIVCDPFLGGGTTAAAAIKVGRKWVGFEKDHDQAVIAMQRCKQ